MGLLGKSRTAPAAGVITTLALVVIFGNQAVTEWVPRHTHGDTVWGWFLRILTWPSWAFGPDGNSAGAVRNLLADDLRAILLVVFVGVVLSLSSKSLVGGAGSFFLGWGSLVFASGFAAFTTAFISTGVTWLKALNAAGVGSAYGLFAGWIVGIAVAAAKRGGGAP